MVRVPVLAVVGVLADGQKGLVELDLCDGESNEAGKGCLDGLVARGLKGSGTPPRQPGDVECQKFPF